MFQYVTSNTAQKMKFSIKDFFSNRDQIRIFLWILSHLLKKSLMENFNFCAVQLITFYDLHIHIFVSNKVLDKEAFQNIPSAGENH